MSWREEMRSMSSSEMSVAEAALPLAELSDRDLQQLLADAVRAYAGRHQEGARFPAFDPAESRVTGTDAVIVASAILEATSVEIFELGMWKAWGTA
jgi:hypothetical protein